MYGCIRQHKRTRSTRIVRCSQFDGRYYLLTAAHVLNGEPDNERIRVLGRPDGLFQMLQGKQELADAIAHRSHKPAFSSATPINITGRLSQADKEEDIAALQVQNPNAVLPQYCLS